MESDEELEEEYENQKNLNNDMSDLKEDDDNSDDGGLNKVTKDDANKSKIFAQKLKHKKTIMDEARKQLPYTFSGKYYIYC